jgi:hypothetical protein
VQRSGSPIADIPAFAFRISAEDVSTYRHALGVGGDRAPFGMALQALATEAVLRALKDMATGRHPIHVAQAYTAERPLRAGVDYHCEISLQPNGADRLRIMQRLSDPSGNTCLLLVSEIVLVSP